MTRRFPIGAEVQGVGVSFRVWAPRRRAVTLVAGNRTLALEAKPGGYFEGFLEGAGDGLDYGFRLDDDPKVYPDPASRFQPEGPDGPSRVVDPSRFEWTDRAWKGPAKAGHVVYELHVGTFTHEGTWAAAQRRLPDLADLGVTLIEVMPVAEFPGRFGWGYDGVDMFAPTRLYGAPDDFRRFVDAAHALGVGVILDVVYNHFGPSGNYLAQYAAAYFTKRYTNEWGDALNFDGEDSGPVREFFVSNAAYWIAEFHLDGLRLDATQSIHDRGPVHIVTEVVQAARHAAGERSIWVVAENEPQDSNLVRAVEHGGMGLDALWNDDFHHATHVVVTGNREAYYHDYHGSPQELISAAKWGYLYQGQRYAWQKNGRGTPGLDIDARSYVTYLENHDQVANSASGQRLHELGSAGIARCLIALMLLIPSTPMLFQGQEWGASAPFLYFADHETELAGMVERGRKEFLSQFPSITAEVQARLPAPHAPDTFERCRLDHAEKTQGRHAQALALHRDLLRLRREDPVISGACSAHLHGAVLSTHTFLLRWLDETEGDRLLLVNLGAQATLHELPEPLLAPPLRTRWGRLWSSEWPDYGGHDAVAVFDTNGLTLPGFSAVLMLPVEVGS